MNQPLLTPPEQATKDELLGNEMLVNHLIHRVHSWDDWPLHERRPVVNIAGFFGAGERLILKTPWELIPPINRAKITIGMIELLEAAPGIRGRLV